MSDTNAYRFALSAKMSFLYIGDRYLATNTPGDLAKEKRAAIGVRSGQLTTIVVVYRKGKFASSIYIEL